MKIANFKYNLKEKIKDRITNKIVIIFKREYTEESFNNSDKTRIIKGYRIKNTNNTLIEPNFRIETQLLMVD